MVCEVSFGRLVATSNLRSDHRENLFGRQRKLGVLSVEKGGHGSGRSLCSDLSSSEYRLALSLGTENPVPSC